MHTETRSEHAVFLSLPDTPPMAVVDTIALRSLASQWDPATLNMTVVQAGEPQDNSTVQFQAGNLENPSIVYERADIVNGWIFKFGIPNFERFYRRGIEVFQSGGLIFTIICSKGLSRKEMQKFLPENHDEGVLRTFGYEGCFVIGEDPSINGSRMYSWLHDTAPVAVPKSILTKIAQIGVSDAMEKFRKVAAKQAEVRKMNPALGLSDVYDGKRNYITEKDFDFWEDTSDEQRYAACINGKSSEENHIEIEEPGLLDYELQHVRTAMNTVKSKMETIAKHDIEIDHPDGK